MFYSFQILKIHLPINFLLLLNNKTMHFLQLISGVYFILIVVIPVLIFYIIYKWVNKFISLKEEQNNLLREIIKKMEHQ